jgi:hypothetical protein
MKEIENAGGLAMIEDSTHRSNDNSRWSSGGGNLFIAALREAYVEAEVILETLKNKDKYREYLASVGITTEEQVKGLSNNSNKQEILGKLGLIRCS